MMRIAVLGLLLLAIAPMAGAETVYKWIDRTGQIHYTDRPPTRADAKIIEVYQRNVGFSESTENGDEAGGNGGDEGGDDADEPNDQGPGPMPPPSTAQTRAVEADVAKAKTEQCKKATERYKTYVESRRLYRQTPDGKREYLTDAQLAQARVSAKQDMDEFCR